MSNELDNLSIFDVPSGRHRAELRRVSSKIDVHVLRFCHVGRVFHMDDLTTYVRECIGEPVAPESPGRCLRQLRQEGRLNYTVDRSSSLYTMVPGVYAGARPAKASKTPTRGQLREAYQDLRKLYRLWTRCNPGVELSEGFIATAQYIKDIGGIDD